MDIYVPTPQHHAGWRIVYCLRVQQTGSKGVELTTFYMKNIALLKTPRRKELF